MLPTTPMVAFGCDEHESLRASGRVVLTGVIEDVTRLSEGSRGEQGKSEEEFHA